MLNADIRKGIPDGGRFALPLFYRATEGIRPEFFDTCGIERHIDACYNKNTDISFLYFCRTGDMHPA